jgi:hypothetical protein
MVVDVLLPALPVCIESVVVSQCMSLGDGVPKPASRAA